MNSDRKYISMINKFFLLLIVVCFWNIHLSAQDYKGQVIFHAASLQEKNDTLYMHCDVLVQSGAVNSCNAMRITPVLTTGSPTDSTRFLPYILIQGNSKRQSSDRAFALNNNDKTQEAPYMVVNVKEATDTLLDYNMQIPYQPWMDSAFLIIRQEITGCRNESRLFSFSMNNKIEHQSHEPFQPQPLVSFVEPISEEKRRQKQGQAFLDFQVGSSVIYHTYRRNPEELAKIKDAIEEVIENPDVELKGLFIDGYASPDGKYETNERLSRARTDALYEYIVKRMGNLPGQLIKVNSVAEDWEGLAALVQHSGIANKVKQQVLEIIESTMADDMKEQKLKQLDNGVVYRKMLTDMFPQLRRVEYQIDYSVKDYNTLEAKAMIGKNDEQLSQLEMYRVALSYGEGSKEYEEIILERIPKNFPNDLTAFNNAAALLIKKGELASARRSLERIMKFKGSQQNGAKEDVRPLIARRITPPDELAALIGIINNLAIVSLLEDDLELAEFLFIQAMHEGNKDAKHNLEQLRLKKEDNKKQEKYRK